MEDFPHFREESAESFSKFALVKEAHSGDYWDGCGQKWSNLDQAELVHLSGVYSQLVRLQAGQSGSQVNSSCFSDIKRRKWTIEGG